MPNRAIPLAVALALSGISGAQADFQGCLSGLGASAARHGISAATFARATSGLEPDMKVLDLMQSQPEFKTPIWDYLSGLVDQ